ncbi:MAG: hypothetical protein GXO97_01815 [Nitrospirae bacterium]|nr:hypothetical protein [Nitrospirota bacterium]
MRVTKTTTAWDILISKNMDEILKATLFLFVTLNLFQGLVPVHSDYKEEMLKQVQHDTAIICHSDESQNLKRC